MLRFRRRKASGSTFANRLALIGILTSAGIAAATAVLYWDWLSGCEPPSATLRNLTLVGVAIIGLPLALWRRVIAHRQADTARLSLANDKYQKGAEMLGDSKRYVRLGWVYGLQHMAAEHPERYHLETLRIFCSFLRDQVPLTTKGRRRRNGRGRGVAGARQPYGEADRGGDRYGFLNQSLAAGSLPCRMGRTGHPKLPRSFPFARATAIPSRVRMRIRSLSNAANVARMLKNIFPIGSVGS